MRSKKSDGVLPTARLSLLVLARTRSAFPSQVPISLLLRPRAVVRGRQRRHHHNNQHRLPAPGVSRGPYCNPRLPLMMLSSHPRPRSSHVTPLVRTEPPMRLCCGDAAEEGKDFLREAPGTPPQYHLHHDELPIEREEN